jgi:hypothetical protein
MPHEKLPQTRNFICASLLAEIAVLLFNRQATGRYRFRLGPIRCAPFLAGLSATPPGAAVCAHLRFIPIDMRQVSLDTLPGLKARDSIPGSTCNARRRQSDSQSTGVFRLPGVPRRRLSGVIFGQPPLFATIMDELRRLEDDINRSTSSSAG